MGFFFSIIEYIATIIEFSIFFWCSSLVLRHIGTKKSFYFYRVIAAGGIFLATVSIGNELFSTSLIIVYFYYLIFSVSLLFVYRVMPIAAFLAAMLAFLICHTLDLSLNLFLGILSGAGGPLESFWAVMSPGMDRIIFMLFDDVCKIIIIFLLCHTHLFSHIEDISLQEKKLVLIISLCAHIILLSTNFLLLNESEFLQNFAIIIEEASILLLTLISIYSIERKSRIVLLEEKNDLLRSANETIYESQVQQMAALDAEYKRSHEYRHTLQVLLAKEDIGVESKQYIQNLFDQSIQINTLVADTGDPFIDAVINSHYSSIQENNIDFHYSSSLSHALPFDPVDTVSLISNLLENAIHACLLMPPSDKRWITIAISQSKAFYIIKIDNSYADKKESELSNSRRHGFGTDIIKSIAANNNGDYLAECKDSVYSVTVILQHWDDTIK